MQTSYPLLEFVSFSKSDIELNSRIGIAEHLHITKINSHFGGIFCKIILLSDYWCFLGINIKAMNTR